MATSPLWLRFGDVKRYRRRRPAPTRGTRKAANRPRRARRRGPGGPGVSPPLDDGPHPALQLRLAIVLSDPHPLADLRFLRPHEDLTPLLTCISLKPGPSAGTFF
jgi:hypothetical protein